MNIYHSNIVLTLSVIGSIYFFSKSVFFFSKDNSKLFLSTFLLSLCLLSSLMLFVNEYGDYDNPLINLTSLLFYVNILCIAPAMYLYLTYLIPDQEYENLEYTKANIIHFYPSILLLIINITAFVVIYIANDTWIFYSNVTAVMEYSNLIAILFIFLIQNIYFVSKAVVLYRSHTKNIKNVFSSPEGLELNWIRLYLSLYTIFILGLYLMQTGLLPVGFIGFTVFVFSYVVYISFKGYKQASIQSAYKSIQEDSIENKENVSNLEEKIARKYSSENDNKEIISPEKALLLKNTLENLMLEKRPYLNATLNINDLAKMADTNTKYLSYVINTVFNKNFVSYINNYRVKEAIVLLDKKETSIYTIETIGEMSGFKSKSSFYSSFKDNMKMTPSQYRKTNNI